MIHKEKLQDPIRGSGSEYPGINNLYLLSLSLSLD